MKTIYKIWSALSNVCGMDCRLLVAFVITITLPAPNELAQTVFTFVGGALFALTFANPHWRAICAIHQQSAEDWHRLYEMADQTKERIVQEIYSRILPQKNGDNRQDHLLN